jgi:streptogramin lyase
VLASVPLDPRSAPAPVVAAYGAVWAAAHRATWLYRIDPTTNTVTARIDVGQKTCGAIGVGFSRLWLGPCNDGDKVVVVDPATNTVVGSVPAVNVNPSTDGTSLWAGSYPYGLLRRIDPATYATIATFDINGGTLAYGDGYLWSADVDLATNDYSGTIWKIDPAANRVVATLHTPPLSGVAVLSASDGSVWMMSGVDGTLMRVDTKTGRSTTTRIPGFTELSQFGDVNPATDGTHVWIRSSDGVVTELEVHTLKPIASYRADPGGGGGYIAVAFDSLWVANFGTGTVWRDRITP